MKNSNILLSIVTPTLNNQKDIRQFINSVKRQNKVGFNVEIIIADGGSTDQTRSIAKKMGARVISNPYVFADPGVNLGIKHAKGSLLIVLAADNIFEDRNSFKKLVSVFKNKQITAAFPMQVSGKKDSLYTKYINQFTDPFNHFVYGYASNGRTFKKVYATLKSTKIYDVYDYTSSHDKPLIAFAQGFMVRKGFRRNKKSAFDDVLPVIELLSSKKNIAFVHSVTLHHHTVRDLKHFARKQAWATINALQGKKYGISHRLEYLSASQKFRARIWPLYSLSFVLPLMRSIYGLVKDKEILWIFHAFLCMISALASTHAGITFLLNKNKTLERQ